MHLNIVVFFFAILVPLIDAQALPECAVSTSTSPYRSPPILIYQTHVKTACIGPAIIAGGCGSISNVSCLCNGTGFNEAVGPCEIQGCDASDFKSMDSILKLTGLLPRNLRLLTFLPLSSLRNRLSVM